MHIWQSVLQKIVGKPVVIICTGATASRNYYPKLTKAFYRNLPALAVIATQPREIAGQYVPQVIDMSSMPKDTSNYIIHIPIVKDNANYTFAVLKVNAALHYLKKDGGRPVNIKIEET